VKKALFTAVTIFIFVDIFGNHLRGGQITITPVNCASNTYRITLTIFTNTNSPVHVSGGDAGVLDFGDGGPPFHVPEQDATLIDKDNAVGLAQFSIDHVFPSQGTYVVSYYEQNRNAGVLNFTESVNVPFYIESSFSIDPSFCTHYMYFSIPPTDRGCSELAFTHNPGAVVTEGDSLSYEIVTPLMASNTPVPDYQNPNASKFYPTNYGTANEQGNGPPTFSIDQDGTLTWDSPGMVGEYDIAIKVFLWVSIDGVWVNTSWVTRDMQVIVEDCGAARPYMTLPPNLCAQVGDNLAPIIRGYSKVFSPVKIEVTTLDNFSSPPPVFTNAGVFQSTAPPFDTANLKVKWNITCELVRPKPYRFVFKISSYTQSGIRISSYGTWDVTVTGPPPQYQSMALDLATKKLSIQWKDYVCPNAKTVQVWRRVARGPLRNDQCLAGIPKSWGFSKIGETTDNSFTDKNLAPGATYCYRLVAFYTTPNQAFSVASKDTCIGPIVADAPVVTNVSVNVTDKSQGAVVARWTRPFQINRTLFPSPYLYDVFRTVDGTNFKLIKSRSIDTTYVDSNLDVVDSLYGYKIVVYSPQSIARDNPIDTSALAFYPRLAFEVLVDTIKLSWDAQVPWSNQSVKFPSHYIYRKELGATAYTLIDSVDVMLDGEFVYKDYPEKKTFATQNNTVYQYKIETQGVYGNPNIKEPLQNFSNEVIAQAVDKNPPCAPALVINSTDCDAMLNGPCNSSALANQLSWTYPDGCGNDVAQYQVFFSEQQNADSTLTASTSDMIYLDQKKNSRAGCYRVFAVDRSGNVGPSSNVVCVDNCAYVFVPNFISVNNDGLNETFPGLSDVKETREPSKCPRFVKEFSLQIFDRWGEQVYSLDKSNTTNPNSEWKGLDKNGKELPTGLYYYSMDIFFYALNPAGKSQKVKGWVSLVR
jgi:hypothetical protein